MPRSEERRFHPSLAHAVHFGIFALLLLLVLTLWLALPLLDGIAEKARETRDVHVPAITRWRHNTQRSEQLYNFINTLYRSEDPTRVRNIRLQSQVLANGFSFEPDKQLAKQAERVMQSVLPLTNTRLKQHQLEQAMAMRANRIRQSTDRLENLFLNREPPMLAAVTVSHLTFTTAAETRYASLHATNWPELIDNIRATEESITNLLQYHNEHNEAAQELLALLQQQRADANQILSLQSEAEAYYQSAINEQRHLSSLLNTDATLSAQDLAQRMEDDAGRVQTLAWTFILAFVAIGALLIFGFNYLVLRPILKASNALEMASAGKPIAASDKQHTFFSELNMIARNVQRYGDTTQELRRLNNELEKLSQLDGLTGIANRRHFDTALQQEFNRAQRHRQSLALVLLDIDHFKQINDHHGHLQGDDCLKAFASLLRRFTQRSGDLAARYGGEEFVLILPTLPLTEAQNLCEQIRAETPQLSLYSSQGELISLSVSAGLAYTDTPTLCSTEEMLETADTALYEAKKGGRNQVVTRLVNTTASSAKRSG
ncbi:GGDEF domain-containing protein [Marinobacterium lutimaris]|uniref:diguanylate cyclase n=1 Tax=Marinobacterium lutimaris TaxID=568106 RepID=A0A1H6AW75_9GAMM|nr:diguanylate cyclase [Marinobacterium lutimaris]SEG52849.1 diguanylate cyclase (GGDEF) domain-containing protein [Marinobacterium lutimaris]